MLQVTRQPMKAMRNLLTSSSFISAADMQRSVLQTIQTRTFAGKAKKQKKKGKGGMEDQNFELMLRTIKGKYPDNV